MGRKKTKVASDVVTEKKKRLNLRVDAPEYEVFSLHCMKKGLKPGAYFMELVRNHCREWNIHAMPGTSQTEPQKGRGHHDDQSGETKEA